MNCKICEIHPVKENLILEKKFFFVRHSEFSKNVPGYLYIEPKKHIENYSEFSKEEFYELSECLEFGVNWIYKYFSPKKIYTVTISEAVPHIHFHLVPRYIDEFKGFSYLQKAVSGELELYEDSKLDFEVIKKNLRLL